MHKGEASSLTLACEVLAWTQCSPWSARAAAGKKHLRLPLAERWPWAAATARLQGTHGRLTSRKDLG